MGASSHVGMVRSENQDHWAWWEPEDDEDLRGKGRVLVVCDGMGGHNGGIVASRTTVEAMLESFEHSATCNLKRLLSTAIDKGNASVRATTPTAGCERRCRAGTSRLCLVSTSHGPTTASVC